ncbi:ABC transporter ATP-binding protein [Kitasatospora sp. McL0602]|uniref:ABC transporter ATP-binding protein n=1 Tax=Kitasatospora sp. McL0602 TaxID=3439530 RepID=UPI003F8AB60A
MTVVLDVDRLTITYGSLTAAREISFQVAAGEIVGLVGPNGAGKTSIVESVGGLRRAVTGGSISLCGVDPQRDRKAVGHLVGMQLQESLFPSRARVGELCDLYEAIYRAPGAAHALLETFGLADRRRSLISTLSGGQRQRLALALAQTGDVRLVVLDELTTGLDPRGRRDTWSCVLDLAARGVAVLLTSHDMEEVETLCARVGVLRSGELLAFDTPARLTAAHGGQAAFRVDLDSTGPDADLAHQLDCLGLAKRPSTVPRRLNYTGRFPEDFNRLTDLVRAAGLPASAVQHRSPAFEDAYLGLVEGAPSPERSR